MKKSKILIESITVFFKYIKKHNISEYAAQGSYYIILSFIPFIILLLTMIQYIGIDKQNLYFMIQTIVPKNMNETIVGIIQEVYSKSIGTISISGLIVIWSAGKGFYSLGKGLEEINEKKEKTTYIFLKIRAIICTIIFSFLIIAALILLVFGKILSSFIENKFNNINIFNFIFKIKDFGVTICLFIFLILIYKYIPKNKNKLRQHIPGAAIASVGWIILSKIFSIYLTIFKGFSVMYGSLTTIVLIMMWVYLCIYTILIGAEINNVIFVKKSKI